MRNSLFFLLCCFLATAASAQENYYVPLLGKVLVYAAQTNQGKTVSLTKHYRKKSTLPHVYTIINKVYRGPAFTKEEGTVKMSYKLDNGTFYADPGLFLPQTEGGVRLNENEIKQDILFPINPKVGDKIKGFSLKFLLDDEIGGKRMLMTATESNRTVAVKESVTTAAGTFECLRFDYDVTNKVMGHKINSSVRTWFAKGYGVIKLEMSLKGVLTSRSILE